VTSGKRFGSELAAKVVVLIGARPSQSELVPGLLPTNSGEHQKMAARLIALLCHETAVDRHRQSGDIGSAIRTQPRHCLADLLGLTQPF
jgi:hypothetical protein